MTFEGILAQLYAQCSKPKFSSCISTIFFRSILTLNICTAFHIVLGFPGTLVLHNIFKKLWYWELSNGTIDKIGKRWKNNFVVGSSYLWFQFWLPILQGLVLESIFQEFRARNSIKSGRTCNRKVSTTCSSFFLFYCWSTTLRKNATKKSLIVPPASCKNTTH